MEGPARGVQALSGAPVHIMVGQEIGGYDFIPNLEDKVVNLSILGLRMRWVSLHRG
jgi:hypothetical protein